MLVRSGLRGGTPIPRAKVALLPLDAKQAETEASVASTLLLVTW